MWYLWSCAAFLGVLYLLWVPLRAMAVERGEALGTAYQKNVAFLTVIWFLYPIVFLIGPEGLKIISDPTSVWAILIMDVLAKVVYAFYAPPIWRRRCGIMTCVTTSLLMNRTPAIGWTILTGRAGRLLWSS
ncbi:Bacteriorhodopsin-like protein [Sphingomonas paucimobilis]|nr:Bacteriorhodopsin-like protein [Sphingomonas paucimobilis]